MENEGADYAQKSRENTLKSRFSGKRVGSTMYVHRSGLYHLKPGFSDRVFAGAEVARVDHWNVAKLALQDEFIVSLLVYEDFDAMAFPALLESHRIDLSSGKVSVRRYGRNPPILHRKELLLAPDDPRRPTFAALTEDLERRGLFVDMAWRGRKEAWDAALRDAGLLVQDHVVATTSECDVAPVVPRGPSGADGRNATETVVARHRTAINRSSLSAPMAALNAAGLLEDGMTVLDYGCGRGDDVRALQAARIDAVGWDPHFAPDRRRLTPRAVVNLGFVLNVVEEPEERRHVLRAAFDHAERCLAVAVMLVGRGDVSGLRPHRDGYLTSRGTFQRYYTQAELRAFLLETLEVTPVAAGPGIFFVFRDEEMEQQFLARRQIGVGAPRQIPSVPRLPSVRDSFAPRRQEAVERVRDDLVEHLLAMGRAPDASELPNEVRSSLTEARVSLRSAISDALQTIPEADMAAATAKRTEEVGRFFALGAFSGRAAYHRLAPSLQRDVRAFFGTLRNAEAAGHSMLFDAGDVEALTREARVHSEAGLGHLTGDKFQVHARDVERLSPRLRTYIGIGQTVAGSLEGTTLYRIHLSSKKLSALFYPDFETSALPRLSERTKINLLNGDVTVFDHQSDGRVSALMEKSHYMTGDEERYDDQLAFELALHNHFGDKLALLPFAQVASGMIRAGLALPY